MAPVADFAYSVAVPEGLSVLGQRGGGRRRGVGGRRRIATSHCRSGASERPKPRPTPPSLYGWWWGCTPAWGRGAGRATSTWWSGRSPTSPPLRCLPVSQPTLALTPELGGGIEYPGHIMQGSRTLDRTTPHEVGHQWFYGLVGNDQGRDPWLDEGLASWAEARFEETAEPYVATSSPTGPRADGGAHDLLGDPPAATTGACTSRASRPSPPWAPPDMVDCGLRHYVAGHAFAVATPADLIASLGTVFPDAAATLAPFGIAR